MIQTKADERADVIASTMTMEQEAAIRALRRALQELNDAEARCVRAGLFAELQRIPRLRHGVGYLTDQLVPAVQRQAGAEFQLGLGLPWPHSLLQGVMRLSFRLWLYAR